MWAEDGSLRAPGEVATFEVYHRLSSRRSDLKDTDRGGQYYDIRVTHHYENYYYRINYDAILYWLKNSGSNPFPAQLRSGGILYYSSIPDTVDISKWPMPSGSQAQRDQRFWKEYIDEMLGVEQWGLQKIKVGDQDFNLPGYTVITPKTGYGDDFAWEMTDDGKGAAPCQILPKPEYFVGGNSTWSSSGSLVGTSKLAYMDYRDNPKRPKTRVWFGPMTMMDFLANPNRNRHWLPGACTEAPMWQAKAGVQAAVQDIKNNHPNDQIALISFSGPAGYNAGSKTLSTGYYNQARAPLGRNYNQIVDSLWFAPRTISSKVEISPYDADMAEVPRAVGGTNYAMGLMLAYNQFAQGKDNTTLRTYAQAPYPYGSAGGLGRKGAQKVVIFETDGACSASAYSSLGGVFVNNGPYNSYFKVRQKQAKLGAGGNEYPNYLSGDPDLAEDQAKEVIDRICSLDTNNSAPGFGLARRPVRVHCLAFGEIFDANSPAPAERDKALSLLQYMQYRGGVQRSPGDPLEEYKRIYGGNYQARIDKMTEAFRQIMQDAYSVTLIEAVRP